MSDNGSKENASAAQKGTCAAGCSGRRIWTQEEARFMYFILDGINSIAAESFFNTNHKLIKAETILDALKPWADRI